MALVWLAMALLTGQAISSDVLRVFSIAASLATIVFLLYDHFIWKWYIVRLFTGKPTVAGTWRGLLQSDYIRPGESQPVAPIPTVIRVKQTNSTLVATLFTGESSSVTEQGRLIRETDGRWRLSWIYVNEPRPPFQHRSNHHCGVCDLYLAGRDGELLTGRYFTDRKTVGEIELPEWSKASYGDAASALAASEFEPAKPFARWRRP
ncbi:hypothetical protein [Actinomadura decatromicini]|uniref:CD-NTase-associated protein 15 domain-containing protein n=1 Tax=Actinomadura decatromicini TaxID=2604572 RepID=A0A5D3FB17_9ACTN|nr:hypothetical protein FXF68_34465 [Actinomadura decatromicini]